jgi:hypothetical protein
MDQIRYYNFVNCSSINFFTGLVVLVCVSLFYVIDTGSIRTRARIKVTELGVTYLPSTFSSDAGYADLPLALLGAPVSIRGLW